MKDKILMLIIGILIGAVIASGCFLLFQNTTNDRGMGSRQDMNQNMIGGLDKPTSGEIYVNDTNMFNTNNIDEMDNFIKKITDKYNLDDNNINSYSTASRNEENELNIMIKVFIYTFIGIITLIGILNIYNAINSSLEVRRKEIISLITLGMEEKQINKMILLENMLCGLISLVLGILFGIFISYLIYFLTVNYRWYAFEMPWNSLVISLILIVLIIIFFTFYLKKRLFSGNLIEILKREN